MLPLLLACAMTGAATPPFMVIPDVSPTSLTLQGGRLWFSNGLEVVPGGMTLGSVAGGHVKSYAVWQGAPSHGIVSKGHTIWFLLNSSSASPNITDGVGRLDTVTDSVTTYKIPTGGAFPEGITISPMGKVFIAETNANAIGEVRNDAGVIEHRLPNGLLRDSGGPSAIAVLANQTVFSILERSGQLVALDNTGRWHFFKTSKFGEPDSLASDGSTLWFADPRRNAIAEVAFSKDLNPSRTHIIFHNVPWPTTSPANISVGAGKVCFTVNSSVAFACYSKTSRRFQMYSVHSEGARLSDVLPTGGRIWYAAGRLPQRSTWFGGIGSITP